MISELHLSSTINPRTSLSRIISSYLLILSVWKASISRHPLTNNTQSLGEKKSSSSFETATFAETPRWIEELVLLASTDAVKYSLIDSTGINEPMQVAQTFTTESSMIIEQEGTVIENKEDESAISKEWCDYKSRVLALVKKL